MIGTVKHMIEELISQKAAGDKFIENSIRVKLILKGIDIDSYTDSSRDSEEDTLRVKEAAEEYGICL